MIDTTHVKTEAASGVLIARIKCEKLSEYESLIVQNEISGLAPGFNWKVAIDFDQVTIISSVGLGMLVSLNSLAKAAKGRIALFGMNDSIRSVFKLTRLDSGFTIVVDHSAAVKALT